MLEWQTYELKKQHETSEQTQDKICKSWQVVRKNIDCRLQNNDF